jgi:hypothetical protein
MLGVLDRGALLAGRAELWSNVPNKSDEQLGRVVLRGLLLDSPSQGNADFDWGALECGWVIRSI